ncbi:MAG: triose-phosphate isomerase [Dysosmobacter sp.]
MLAQPDIDGGLIGGASLKADRTLWISSTPPIRSEFGGASEQACRN